MFVRNEEVHMDKPGYQDFTDWCRDSGTQNPPVDALYVKGNYLLSRGPLMKMSLMQLKACFSLSHIQEDKKQEINRIDEFFNMDYASWVEMMFDEHLPGLDLGQKAQLTNAAMMSMHVCPAVVECIKQKKELAVRVIGHTLDSKAQQLDMYYSNLVHGAAVKVPLSEIWCPNNEMEHSDRDTDKFFSVMWRNLKKVLETAMSSSVSVARTGIVEYTSSLLKSIKAVKDVKRHMKEIWEESKTYRISDRVHMTEIQILQRLKADGVFEWLDSESALQEKGMQNLHMCFFMRRYVVHAFVCS